MTRGDELRLPEGDWLISRNEAIADIDRVCVSLETQDAPYAASFEDLAAQLVDAAPIVFQGLPVLGHEALVKTLVIKSIQVQQVLIQRLKIGVPERLNLLIQFMVQLAQHFIQHVDIWLGLMRRFQS